jgi:putative membrane protein
MIRNFSDHAANERTFLAWVRTAVAIMAFGFLVEKFDLFMRMARISLGLRAPHPIGVASGLRIGEAAGLGLMVLGLALVTVCTWRFLRTARQIDDEADHVGPGARFDLALAVLIFLLGAALLAYLVSNILAR